MKHLIKRDLRPAYPAANEEESDEAPAPKAEPAEDRATEPEPAPAEPAETVEPADAPADDTEAIIAAAKAAKAGGAPSPATPRTCLVVDDSRMIRKVARRIVEGLDFVVVEAENGEEAIAQCKGQIPDLVLTDWDMPVMTGLEFVTALRALPGADRAKVVFCTSKSEAHDIHAGIAAGADEYVVKPFDELKLRRKLETLGFG